VDLCFADLWGHPDHDGPERFALGNQSAIEGPLQSNRARLGWLGAAQGLTDVAIAWSLITSGKAQRALVTSVGLAGDIAAVVLEGQS
jgi:hypothetical protein